MGKNVCAPLPFYPKTRPQLIEFIASNFPPLQEKGIASNFPPLQGEGQGGDGFAPQFSSPFATADLHESFF
jgi:hypothetical protein